MIEVKRRVPDAQGKLVFGGIVAYLMVLLLIPLGALVLSVVRDFGDVVRQLTSGEALHAIGLTLLVALACITLNGIFGVAGALVFLKFGSGQRQID